MQISPVLEVFRSRMALVATVVPQENAWQPPSSSSRAMLRRSAIIFSPLKMPSEIFPDVVDDL
ncbi:hypothetical protein D3C71_2200830 [compost metagenome]